VIIFFQIEVISANRRHLKIYFLAEQFIFSILNSFLSFGKACALKNFPGVYSKVSAGVEWIQKLIDERQCGISSIPNFNNLFGENVSGKWSCKGNFVKKCEFTCNDGYIAAITECKLDGENNWSVPSKSELKAADCNKCDLIPDEFGILKNIFKP